MAVKTHMTPDALAVRILKVAIYRDMDVWAACDVVQQKFADQHVEIPFSLREKACEIANQKLEEMDAIETELNEARMKKLPKVKNVKKGPKSHQTLREQNLPDPPQQMADFQAPPQKPVSLDQAVDRYIVRYERESIPLEGQPNGPGIAPAPGSQPAGGAPSTLEESAELKKLLKFLLLEQAPPPSEEEPTDDAPADDLSGAPSAGDDLGGGGDAPDLGGMDDVGGGDGDGASPPESSTAIVNTPQINLNEFSRSIARLVNNYNALLNPRTIILNRVEAYLRNNYNETTAKYFMQIMERNYGLNVTSIEYPEDKNEFPTTYGVGAYEGGSGGGGA